MNRFFEARKIYALLAVGAAFAAACSGGGGGGGRLTINEITGCSCELNGNVIVADCDSTEFECCENAEVVYGEESRADPDVFAEWERENARYEQRMTELTQNAYRLMGSQRFACRNDQFDDQQSDGDPGQERMLGLNETAGTTLQLAADLVSNPDNTDGEGSIEDEIEQTGPEQPLQLAATASFGNTMKNNRELTKNGAGKNSGTPSPEDLAKSITDEITGGDSPSDSAVAGLGSGSGGGGGNNGGSSAKLPSTADNGGDGTAGTAGSGSGSNSLASAQTAYSGGAVGKAGGKRKKSPFSFMSKKSKSAGKKASKTLSFGTKSNEKAQRKVANYDESDYFSRIGVFENLFKVVERKYRSVSSNWAVQDSKKALALPKTSR